MQYGIIAESFEELITKMNNFEKNKEVFASQVYPIRVETQGNLRWYGIIYFKNLNQSKKEFFESKQGNKIPITEAQQNFIKLNEKKLKERGFDINNIQSKEDAFKIIKEFKEMA